MYKGSKNIEFLTIQSQTYLYCRKHSNRPYNFLDICFKMKFSINGIAERFDISNSSLRMAFLEYAGISPKTWMVQNRVLICLRLLREGKSLNAVGEVLGYHDYPHMAKEFKSVIGQTPKDIQAGLLSRQVEQVLLDSSQDQHTEGLASAAANA